MIQDGLILSLDAADKNSYPGSGTTWIDTSGRGNNSSLVNGVSYSSANNGVMVLDGTDDIVLAPPVNTLGAIPEHTFEIWVKSPGLGPGKSIGGLICPDYGMISYIAGGGGIVYQLYNTDSWPTAYYMVSIGSVGINCFDNRWHHIICTRNSATAAIYIDGTLNNSTSGGGIWSGSTIWSGMSTSIGNNPNDVYYHLLGNIAIAKIYNRSLSAIEIQNNYIQYKTRFNL